jgi:hypothetical protein
MPMLAQIKEVVVVSYPRYLEGGADHDFEWAVIDMAGSTLYQSPWRECAEAFIRGELK